MKAILKPKGTSGIEFREVDIPSIGKRDLLVRVKAAVICGTDTISTTGLDTPNNGSNRP